MKSFGFLSFGHYDNAGDLDAGRMLRDAVEISVGADELGVNGAYFRVHHFATQAASPIPLLSTIAAKTSNIEVGTGVIDMRYSSSLQATASSASNDRLEACQLWSYTARVCA